MPATVRRVLITAMLLGLVAAIVHVLLSAVGGRPSTRPYQRFAGGALEGLDFAYAGEVPGDTGFLGPDGETLRLADFRGKVVLLNLWATWCAPCEREMPTLGALQSARGGPDFEVVAISVDDDEKADEARTSLADWTGGTLRFFHAPDYAITYDLGAGTVRGFPTSILYDAEGREVARYAGELDWSGYETVALVDAVIAGKR